MGDFNSEPNETPIIKLSEWLNDSFYSLLKVPKEPLMDLISKVNLENE